MILVTGQRRKSFGEGLKNICNALKEIALKFRNEVEIVYPIHFHYGDGKTSSRIVKIISELL